MITYITKYIQNIAIFMVFMTFIMIILPNNKHKNYIQMVLGFILIFILLDPVSTFIYDQDKLAESLMQSWEMSFEQSPTFQNDTIYQDLRNEMIAAQFHSMIKKQIDHLGLNSIYRLISVDVHPKGEESVQMYIVVEEKKVVPTAKPFIRIEPVEFTDISPEVTADEVPNPEIKKLKSAISDFYNLPQDNIHITEQKKNQGDGTLE